MFWFDPMLRSLRRMSAELEERSADLRDTDRSRGRLRAWSLAAPMFVSLVLVVVAAARLDAPFSPEFGSFNTAVWSGGARSVRTDGWWDSRGGARTSQVGADPVPYAHHPPLVRAEVTLAEQVLGPHRWASRLPALLSSLAAIWLCWGWLGALGFSPGPRSFGVVAAGSTSMVVGYALMANMEVVWLPFAFGLLWAWQVAETRWSSADATPSSQRRATAWCLVTGVLGCAAAHQGVLLVAALGVWGTARARRQRRSLRPYEWSMWAATAIGSAGFLAYVTWAAGGLDDLERIARERSASAGWGAFAAAQLEHLFVLYGLVGVACLLAGALLLDRRPGVRGPYLAVVAVAAAYAVVFRQGATIHPYWNAALLPAVALGGALAGDWLRSSARRALPVAMGIAAVLVVATAHGAVRDALVADDAGWLARRAADSSTALHSTEIVAAWVHYESEQRVRPVRNCAAVAQAAAGVRDADVLTSRRWVDAQRSDGWSRVANLDGAVVRGEFALVPATELAVICSS